MTNVIEVSGVTKRFGQVEVLKGVDLQVKSGEIFTLLGENGAGKSTLINILATLSRADQGQVRLFGLDPVTQGRQVRELISLNAQTNTVDGEFTGKDNLALVARLRGIKAVSKAVDAIAERFELTAFMGRQVKTYSGGMKRRLDLAMSLLGDPQLVFLDEPTTGVDPKNRLALWQMIREIRDAGKTVFLTTQYLDEADALSDQIAFIHDGVIVKSGTPAQIKQRVTPTYTIGVAASQAAQAQQTLRVAGITFSRDERGLSLAENDAPQGLSQLIEKGIGIDHYDRDELDLETVFLAVSKQEESHAKR